MPFPTTFQQFHKPKIKKKNENVDYWVNHYYFAYIILLT